MNDALAQNKNEELAARGHELRGMAGKSDRAVVKLNRLMKESLDEFVE